MLQVISEQIQLDMFNILRPCSDFDLHISNRGMKVLKCTANLSVAADFSRDKIQICNTTLHNNNYEMAFNTIN